MKKKKHWYKKRKYLHLEVPPSDSRRVISYILSKKNIEKHAFLPFVYRRVIQRKFRKEYDKDGKVLHNKRRIPDKKERGIYFAGHVDSNILAYYSYLLTEQYEKHLKVFNLTNVVTAYRSIPIPQKKRNRSTIDSAEEVFEFIRDNKNNELVAITLDISSFFNNLDHSYIKKSWCSVLGVNRLPPDHYNVFRNITKFSFVNEKDVFNLFREKIILKETEKGFKRGKIERMSHLKEKNALGFCTKQDFIKVKKNTPHLVKSNKYMLQGGTKILRKKGIPQGSTISATLANIYLLEFDKYISNILRCAGGIYRRYSDDIIVVCPLECKDDINNILRSEIEKYELEIHPKKTQIFHFKKCLKENRFFCTNETESKKIIQTKNLSYLGFDFDGEYTSIRSSSISKYYRKMKRGVRRSIFFSKRMRNSTQGQIFMSRLYKRYTHKGAKRRRVHQRDKEITNKWILTYRYDWGNYLSYAYMAARVMKKNKIRKQLRRHWSILHKLLKK